MATTPGAIPKTQRIPVSKDVFKAVRQMSLAAEVPYDTLLAYLLTLAYHEAKTDKPLFAGIALSDRLKEIERNQPVSEH